MIVKRYLPSAQFLVIVGSLAMAGGVVAAAQYYTSSHDAPATLSSTDGATAADDAWQQSLADIQAQSGVSLPDAPSEDTVDTLLTQAQSSNLTDSVGRSLLVRLASAGTQGLGDDIPTQDSIIAEANAQINASGSATPPPAITTTDTSAVSQRAYGNEVIMVLRQHPGANLEDTQLALAKATDTRDSSQLTSLATIGAEYRALARELAAVPVPTTLAPLHKQVVADLSLIADTYPEMKFVVDDPLRGLTALQNYQQLLAEIGRVFTNIAGALNKGGILFSKDEPGSAWNTFLAP